MTLSLPPSLTNLYLIISCGARNVVAAIASPGVVAEHVGVVAARIGILEAFVDVLAEIVRFTNVRFPKWEGSLSASGLPYKTARSRTGGILAGMYTCRTLARSGSGPGRSRHTPHIRPHPAVEFGSA